MKKGENTIRKRKELVAAVGAAFALAFVFALVLPRMKGEVAAPDRSGEASVQEPMGRHPLTGAVVYEKTDAPQVYGVMVDNHVDAWPQAGLNRAFLVFEAPVEAGISRFLAFFHEGQEVKKIGPVRSARPYFLDWNNELDALYAHVGGSDAALDLIVSGGTFDLNEYWLAGYFWRAHNRYAPHNTYTSTERLSSYAGQRHPVYETWTFKDSPIVPRPEVERFELFFYPPTYVVEWKFDSSLNRYRRFQGGSAHTMEDGEQVTADNVAVVVTDVAILDSVGRRRVRTLGEGEAIVFVDGKKKEGRWKKNTQSARLRFYDERGEEIVFNAGVTWVEVIPDADDLSF